MVCPECKNVGFQPTDDVKKPVVNTGKKENYSNFDLRRYVCLQCGYAWMTKETFHREIKVRKNQMNLFEES